MKIRYQSRSLASAIVLASLFVGSVTLWPVPVEAGSLVIPAWSFARGNVQIYVSPDKYADAGPVVGNGPRESWGWTVEYDVDIPVEGKYTIQVRYAAAEARPMEVFVDDKNLGKCCAGVTFGLPSSKQSDTLTWNSSGAKWTGVRNQWGRLIDVAMTKGKHTVKFTRSGPLPHLVTLRLDTPVAFEESWNPPRFKVQDLDRIPAADRHAFEPSSEIDVATLRQPVTAAKKTKAAGSMLIHAWTFDRGNAQVYASPDHYADNGPLVGSGPRPPDQGVVEYDIEFPITAEYTLYVSYAAAEARPVDVFFDGKNLGRCCHDVTYGSAPFEKPVRFTWDSSGAKRKWEGLTKQGQLVKFSATKGTHALKLARRGPLPHLVAMRLDSPTAFPKDWKQTRQMRHLDSVPTTHRSVFLPPNSVNLGALRQAIEERIATFGSRYPEGAKYLQQLAEFEQKKRTIFVMPPLKRSGFEKEFSSTRIWASEVGMPEEERTIEGVLSALRREALQAHPALKFDKLLFVKRKPFHAHIYEDHLFNEMGGGLCVLSPVSPDGKVTNLVPELDGGLFSRFDLSFDAKKVVFGYKKKDEAFRIYEIDIDPAKGVMIPGSLRQLTFSDAGEADAIRKYRTLRGGDRECGYMDTNPVYLPSGKIMFTSTRAQRNIFCFPASVTTLYVMDADGKNLHCISSSPLNEMGPCMLEDGRVVYTRWEYIDKGLGNAQSVWAVRPDGSGSEHLYKNNVVRPAGMLGTRGIPSSQRLVTVGAPHCGREGGPVILVDYRGKQGDTKAMTSITPEIGYPCMFQVTRHMGYFHDPYPFSEKFFLVSHTPGGATYEKGAEYGIYALDSHGNRAELYRDTEISCFQPTPLRPRRKPAELPSVARTHAAKTVGAKAETTGTLFMQDVYEGMTGIERGRVKYLRVMEAMPWPWFEKGRFRNGLPQSVHRKKLHGVVKVHEDGSSQFKVPAEKAIYFQALDENYMALQHMPTYVNLMPGERRSCIGCHENRRSAPSVTRNWQAIEKHSIQTITPQPGDTGPRPVHYLTDVQPILNKHCVSCHSGENAKGRLVLTNEPSANVGDVWNRSYTNLVGKGLVSFRDSRYGRSGIQHLPPLSYGSHLSKLTERIRKDPCKGNLTREEFIRIVTWIDANSPYYGDYKDLKE